MNTAVYLISSGLVALFGLAAAFSFLNKDLKKTLLGSDKDGWQSLYLGVALIALGFIIPDYTGAYLLKGVGLLFAAFGALIMIPDSITDPITSPFFGAVYGYTAFLSYRLGVLETGGVAYNTHALVALILPTVAATFFATLAVLSLTSQEFKDRLSQDSGGWTFVVLGLAIIAISPLAALNPALMITTASLGALLFTLGILVAMDDEQVNWLLTKSKAFAYSVVALIALMASRWLY